MYVEAVLYSQYPQRSTGLARERYTQYCRDLHSRYKTSLNENTLLGSQYKFDEMANPLFKQLNEQGSLEAINLMGISYWSHEFDPDYATFGLHLTEKYNLKCKMIDVIDQGSISNLTTLLLIHQHHKNGSSTKSLCLSLDQTTIARSDELAIPIPSKDAAALLALSTVQSEYASIKIAYIKLWTEQQLLAVKFNMVDLILNLLEERDIKIQDCIICCKRNTTSFGALNFYLSQDQKLRELIDFKFLPLELSCTGSFQLIYQLHHKIWIPLKRYVVLLDEDVESLANGLIILEIK